MKEEKDKLIDDLFKKGIGNPENGEEYQEGDWHALEEMLDGSKKRGGIGFWLPILSMAAALLIFLGWWLLTREAVTNITRNPQQQAGAIRNTRPVGGSSTNGALNKLAHPPAATHAVQPASQQNNYQASAGTAVNNRRQAAPASNFNKRSTLSTAADEHDGHDTSTLFANNPGLIMDKNSGNAQIDGAAAVQPANGDQSLADASARQNKLIAKPSRSASYHPGYTLTLLGAPEINGVNTLQGGSSGTNFGVLFSAAIFKKFTISSGATYSTKPYNTAFSNYHTGYNFYTDPTTVQANCRVLDIPLNVDYQLYNKHQNSFSIGTGLSSYIMLRENYEFEYQNQYAVATPGKPVYYTVRNTNKYLFGVANVQATYQRQINSKFGVSLQPYLKLPLTGIGAGGVNLQTTGVAIGVNWNLTSGLRP